MNIPQEIIIKEVLKHDDGLFPNHSDIDIFEKGFIAAINLNIPVKFQQYLQEQLFDARCVQGKWEYKKATTESNDWKSIEQIYYEWFNNIFIKEIS